MLQRYYKKAYKHITTTINITVKWAFNFIMISLSYAIVYITLDYQQQVLCFTEVVSSNLNQVLAYVFSASLAVIKHNEDEL